jgi:NADH dehydrogenase
LGAETDRSGRIRVNPDLSVPGLDGIYALGDTALMLDEHGAPLPALAQVAKQQGKHLGLALAANMLRGEAMPPFRFKNRGNTAVIGRNAAVFDFGNWRLKGWFGWLLWAIIHVFLLIGFENRILVSMQWVWRYFTYERGARLIATGAPLAMGTSTPATRAATASRGRESATSR